jgi:hypothetical protein
MLQHVSTHNITQHTDGFIMESEKSYYRLCETEQGLQYWEVPAQEMSNRAAMFIPYTNLSVRCGSLVTYPPTLLHSDSV